MNALRRVLGFQPAISAATKRDFFRHTTVRWLYNEEKQKAMRYVKFDVEALQREASQAVGANYCVDMKKLAEGGFNKIFELKFDNAKEVIAKIPSKLISPYFVTASEVATMDYARNILGLPVPRVLSWNAREANPVGSEYIIMERSPGLGIHERREILTREAPISIETVKRMIEIQNLFAKNKFSQIGGIYYKEDLPPGLRSTPLLVDGDADVMLRANERFAVGPSPDWSLWRGERAELKDVDRGPWKDTSTYIQARIRLEQRWLQTYAKDHMYPAAFAAIRSPHVEEHLDVLEKLHSIIPHVVPPHGISQPVLWHDDLHAGNVMLEGKPLDISGILDWQYLTVAPLYQQAMTPDCFFYRGSKVEVPPGLCKPVLKDEYANFAEGSEDYLLARRELQQASIWKAYEVLSRRSLVDHLNDPELELAEPLSNATNWASYTWKAGLHHLRFWLYGILSQWESVAHDGAPIPSNIDVEALRLAALEYPKLLEYDINVEALEARLGLGQDGSVDTEKYDEAKAKSDIEAKEWDDEEMGGPYPYQEGAPSLYIQP